MDRAAIEQNFCCRGIASGDLGAVKALWREVFEDEDEYIDAFFRVLHTPGTGVAAFVGGELAAHFFSLPEAVLLTRDGEVPMSYLVSLATRKALRSGGLGSAVARETAALAFSQGAGLACLFPVGASLYGWYERALGTKNFFYMREREFSAADCAVSGELPRPEKLSSADYALLRERLLAGKPHARFSPRFMDWVGYEFASGGLFRLGDACAAVSRERDGSVRIVELLCPAGGFEACAAALARLFDARSCVVRSPAFWGSEAVCGPVRPSVVAAVRPGATFPAAPNAYWGFHLD